MLTPKQAHKLVRSLKAGLNDPMTRHYGAAEFVAASYRERLRKLGVEDHEVHELAEAYAACRLRFKDPARLAWKARQEIRRTAERMYGDCASNPSMS